MEGSVEERKAGEVVREYLRYHGYRNTLQCIQAEAHQQRRPERSEHVPASRWQTDMLKAFDDGDARTVFNLWERAVPVRPWHGAPMVLSLRFDTSRCA